MKKLILVMMIVLSAQPNWAAKKILSIAEKDLQKMNDVLTILFASSTEEEAFGAIQKIKTSGAGSNSFVNLQTEKSRKCLDIILTKTEMVLKSKNCLSQPGGRDHQKLIVRCLMEHSELDKCL